MLIKPLVMYNLVNKNLISLNPEIIGSHMWVFTVVNSVDKNCSATLQNNLSLVGMTNLRTS